MNIFTLSAGTVEAILMKLDIDVAHILLNVTLKFHLETKVFQVLAKVLLRHCQESLQHIWQSGISS